MIKPNEYLDVLGEDFYCYDRQGEREEFDSEEFYNLDLTLDMIIYSYLSHFRKHFSNAGTPGRYNSQEEWHKDLDTILRGLELALVNSFPSEEEQEQIHKARHLLANIWSCLWV